ncbi:transmembrane protein 17 [Lethenteron reissneri]|uniref:transmembrane protein 17 n=1 Tax=Lethenteron reissneri TaxID=7753 RepID=UPI002AB7F0C2|nr:transmembrane protein 17 [Lethenteron reissneri]
MAANAGIPYSPLPGRVRERLTSFSHAVFSGREIASPERAGTVVVSSLPLQMSLYLNAFYYPCWVTSEAVMLATKYPYMATHYCVVLTTVLVFMAVIEMSRLYLGYAGNLGEKVPELAGFWLLSLLLQTPLLLLQLLLLLGDRDRVPPLHGAQVGVLSVLAVLLATQLALAFTTLRRMTARRATHFHVAATPQLLHEHHA